jgi:hypothetical protein
LSSDLEKSLREFDGLILSEQEVLDARRTEAEAGGGGTGNGSARGGSAGTGTGEQAGGAEGAGDEGDGDEGDRVAGSAASMGGGTGGSPDTPGAEPAGGGEGATMDGDEVGAAATGRVPRDVGDGSDDDIVARQLREAAMSEPDPELREKLWDEYRAYKFGEKKKGPNEKKEEKGS